MPSPTYASPIDTRLPTAVPDHFTQPESREMYELFQASLANLSEGVTKYTGAAARPVSEQSTVDPQDSLFWQNLNRLYVPCSEDLTFGSFVNLYNNAGGLTARKANATNNTKPAFGWCNTTAGTLSGGTTEIIIKGGLCRGVGGLTIGQRYWLSTTNGIIANGPAVAAGNIEQYLGVALGSQLLFVDVAFNFIQH